MDAANMKSAALGTFFKNLRSAAGKTAYTTVSGNTYAFLFEVLSSLVRY